jgi:Flp pilus assembly protein TadB
MSASSMSASPDGRTSQDPADSSVGELVAQASEQLSRLVRLELRLAQAELIEKAKRVGIGGGLFGGAGLFAFLALQALAAAAVAGLAVALPVWAAALIVAGALLAVAAIAALTGKKELTRALPPLPEAAIDGVKADVEMIAERSRP